MESLKTRKRKSHAKSRFACSQCKSRRVKCDELKPACGNCNRRRESCSYVDTSPTTSTFPGLVGSEQPHANPDDINQLHRKQLMLMHHYSTSTYATLGLGPQSLDIHRLEIPRLALAHEYLLNTLFALTSLHLAYESPEDASHLVPDAMQYQARALATCRQTLQDLSPTECRAMFQSSAQLGVIALALHCIGCESTLSPRPTDTLVELAQLWRGTSLIHTASKDLVDPKTYELIFPEPDWDLPAGDASDSESQRFLDILRQRAEEQAPVKPTTYQDNEAEPDNQALATTCLKSIRQLELLLQADALEHWRILAWVALVPAHFMGLVSDREPLACAIVLMYSLPLQQINCFWWAENFSRQLVDELVPLVAASGSQLAEIAEWVNSLTPKLNKGGSS